MAGKLATLWNRALRIGMVKGLHGSSFFRFPSVPDNFFQLGVSGPRHIDFESVNAVFSCVSIIAQEVAKLKINHYKDSGNGGRTIVTDSVNKVLIRPNSYQTRSDFWLFMLRSLLFEGNAYAIATRDNQNRINALWPVQPRAAFPHVDPQTGAVFYNYSPGNDPLRVASTSTMVPASEVLHLRMFCPVSPLVGESPLRAAAFSSSIALSIQNSSASFFSRRAQPAGLIRVPGKLNPALAETLKTQWEQNYSGSNMGGTAILPENASWEPITMSAVDSQTVAQYQMTIEDIARVFRIPLFMLGDLTKASFRNVETLNRSFYAQCLGFFLEHIEASLDNLFGFDNTTSHTEFNVEAGLMRAEFPARIEALTKAVQGGIYTPNEARKLEGKPAKEGGDNLFVQQQMITVEQAANPPEPTPPALPPPEPPEDDIDEDDEDEIGRMIQDLLAA